MKRQWKMPLNGEVIIRKKISLYYYISYDNETPAFMEMRRQADGSVRNIRYHIMDQIRERIFFHETTAKSETQRRSSHQKKNKSLLL